LENKKALSQKDLKEKKEGLYFTGLPLVNYDPDTGVGYGVRVYTYDNGAKDSPFFAYTPYRHRVYAQFFQTTGGWSYHEVNYDAPYIFDTLWRIRASLVYERDINKNFFGLSENQLFTLESPRTGKEYDKIGDYLDALRDVEGGTTYARYHKYDIERPNFSLTGEYDLMGGLMRFQVGFMLRYVKIRDYYNREEDYKGNKIKGEDGGDEVDAEQGETLIHALETSGGLPGYDGGWDNYFKLGLAFDTRDFEPDPKNGVFADVTVEATGEYTGSDYDYIRTTLAPRYYISPIKSYQDLTIAVRGVYTFLSGDNIPFYTYNNLSFTDGDKGGLGGYRTLRGFVDSRFTGKAMSVFTLEIRERMFTLRGGGQSFNFMIVPFVDYGSVFDSVAKTDYNSDEWQLGYGAGLRIAWNQATIIMVDYGMSQEGSGIYINFNHIF
jgi:outer membrane protein assembly factor BamA